MKLLLSGLGLFFVTSFYTLQFQDSNGTTQSMGQYQGKKVLLVNIATGSARAGQLAQLQQLQQLYADSLVVIAFPSNSFGHEPLSDSAIGQYCQDHGYTFKLAAKQPVTGQGMQSIYHWLATQSENGMMAQPVLADYQKFLINGSGMLVGVFSAATEPMGTQIRAAIGNSE